MAIKGKKILLISTEPWGESFISKHHYALMLAERGNTVFFCNPPKTGSIDMKTKIASHKNLRVINYTPPISGANRLPSLLRDFLNRITIKKILAKTGVDIDIIWSFDPYRFQNLKLFGCAIKIYHSVDVHKIPLEIQAAETADIVFSTAHRILKRFSHLDTPKYFVNHGLAEYFLEDKSPIEDLPGNPEKIKVGYVGNLHLRYIDQNNLKTIISLHRDCDFHFIGPYKASNLSDKETNSELVNWLQEQKNVFLWGPKPSSELPAILSAMNLFLICYQGEQWVDKMANPHKVLEYLSSGKPIVTTYTDEYRSNELLNMVEKNDDLPGLFQEVVRHIDVHNSTEKQKARKIFAQANTYESQLSRIENHLKEHGLI